MVCCLHFQQVAEGLEVGAHLLESHHLTVHLHQRQGQVGGLAGLLDHHIVEFLRVAELGQHHQNALGVSRLGGVHDPFNAGLILTYDEKLGYFTTSVDASKLTDLSLLHQCVTLNAPENAVYFKFTGEGGSENPASHVHAIRYTSTS